MSAAPATPGVMRTWSAGRWRSFRRRPQNPGGRAHVPAPPHLAGRAAAVGMPPPRALESSPPATPEFDDLLDLARPDLPSFNIVGVGASAGGLEACSQLLHALPAQVGFAVVVVQHLSPGHDSFLPG